MFNRNNYSDPFNPDKKNEKKELVEKLEFYKLDEFRIFLEEFEKKLADKYGTEKTPERIRLEKFKSELSQIGRCRLEAFLIYYDFRTRDLINFVKMKSNQDSDEDVLSTLRIYFGEKLKLPWLRRMNLFDYPFEVEYRNKNEKKCIIMSLDFRRDKIVAKYKIVIRQL